MIKMLSYLKLSRIITLPCYNEYSFATKKVVKQQDKIKDNKKLKALAQAAYHTILFISKQQEITSIDPDNEISSNSSNIPYCSLSKLIIQNLHNKNIQQQYVNQFSTIFDSNIGVELSPHLKSQLRITEAMNNDEKKFVFNPNRLVTIPVFKNLIQFQNKRILHGPPGISKTTSIIFYCYLNSIMNQYQFQCNDNNFAQQIPRIFYLSYQSSYHLLNKHSIEGYLQDAEENVLQKIISNCPKKIVQQINKLKTEKKIHQIYQLIKRQFKKKNLITKSVLDQFNTYISVCKKYNQIQDALKLKTIPQKQRKNYNNQAKLLKQLIQRQYQIWIQYAKNFGFNSSIMFNSSDNMQYQQLLGPPKQHYVGLNFNHHSKIPLIFINYYKYIKKNQGKKQILGILFFDIKRIFKNDQISLKLDQIQNEIMKKNQFISNLTSINFTPYIIRIVLRNISPNNQNQILKTINAYSNINEAEKVVQNIIQIIENKYIDQSNYLASRFCSQGSDQTVFDKLFFLYEARDLMIKIKQQTNQSEYIKLTPSSFVQFKQLGRKFRLQIIDKNLFEVQVDKDKIISFSSKFSIDDFCQVVSFIDNQLIEHIIKKYQIIFKKFLKMFMQNKKLLGDMIDAFSVYFLQNLQCSVNLQLQDKNQKEFKIYKAGSFYHFNFQKQKSVQQRFQNILIQNQISFGYPITKKLRSSIVSKSMDLIITQPIKDMNNKFRIHSIDLTVSNDQYYINAKVDKMNTLFKNIFQNYHGTGNSKQPQLQKKNQPKIFEWIHYIASNYKTLQQLKKIEVSHQIGNQNIMVRCEIKHMNLQKFNIKINNQENDKIKNQEYDIDQMEEILDWIQNLKQISSK